MRNLEKIEEALCDVLQSYAEGGIKSAADVATIKHALSGMVKIKVLEEMDKYEGSSFRRSYDGNASNDGSYRRDSRGRYMDGGSYRHYRDGGNMKEKLQDLLQEAEGKERQVIQEMLGRL